MSEIKLTINGKLCTGTQGETILTIAERAGIVIPTLCHNESVAHYGACGLCVVECEGRSDIDPKKNLCYKAADRFYASLHNKLDAEGSSDGRYAFPRTVIRLKKNIPSESGMGGGSSDAASVLIILQEHYGNPFTEEELGKLAVNVGADVPFFLYGGTCLCERVGEEVTPIASLADLPILIVKPSAGVSTPECFKAIDSAELEEFDGEAYAEYISHLTEQKESPADKLGSFLSGGELLVNDLQAPAVSAVPFSPCLTMRRRLRKYLKR